MGFFKALFGGKIDTPAEKQKKDEARDLDVLTSDGIRAMRTGHPDHAVKCFRRALEIRDDLRTHDLLSQALIQCDQLKPAMDELRLLAESQTENIQIPITMARVAYLQEDYGAMAAACERASLIDKDNADVAFLYGRAALGQHDPTNAVAMFSKAILLNGDMLEAYLQRGQTLLAEGDLEAAADDADHLMGLAGHNEDVLLLKARVLVAQDKKEEAVEVYGRVVEANPFCAAAYQERSVLLRDLGDDAGADDDMQHYKEIEPADGKAEDIEQKVRQAYRNLNPFGLG